MKVIDIKERAVKYSGTLFLQDKPFTSGKAW